jgi:hypothetical protein
MKTHFNLNLKNKICFSAILIFIVAVLFFSSASYSGGSFILDDIKPILNQAPVIQKYLFTNFELEKIGDANRIGNNVNPRLGGTRLGPYCVNAKPKGAKGKNTFKLCINTEYQFRDQAGKPCKLEQAYSVKEKFGSVEIKPIKE